MIKAHNKEKQESSAKAKQEHPDCCHSLVQRFLASNVGFTLIEVLIAMGIVSFVLGGIYVAYRGQLRTFNTQEQVVDMQQNARVAMYFLERELRMAGLDPTGNADAGITAADNRSITFSMDFAGGANDGIDNDRDGDTDDGADTEDNDLDTLTDEPDEAEWYDGDTNDPDEVVTYVLSNDVVPGGDGNGVNDGLRPDSNPPTEAPCNLLRNGQVIASNIDALNFSYLGVDPDDNTCGESCPWDPLTDDLEDIRTVQVTIVARAGASVRTLSTNFTNNTTYMGQKPNSQVVLPPQGDNFRRIRLTTSVRCRNLGL